MKGEFVMLSKFISSLKQEFGGYNAAALTKEKGMFLCFSKSISVT